MSSVRISSLNLQDFRSVSLANINFNTPITILTGANNAGKTTILESLYFCSNLKSFKSITNQDLIKNNKPYFKISLNFIQNDINYNIFIEKSLKSAKCLLNNKKLSKKTLNTKFPCYALVFGFNNILLNDSSYRRDFVDSGVFHVEHGSYDALSTYNKIIKQRNYLLKTKNTTDLTFWDEQLVKNNSIVGNYRFEYFKQLKTELANIINNLKKTHHEIYHEIESIDIDFIKGWTNDDYQYELEQNRNKDLSLGHTSSGSHRCDFVLTSNNKPVKESGSMSTLVLSCLLVYLAKINVFHVKHGYRPTLLIDDLFFGIDNKNLNTVIKLLVNSKGNIVITSPSIYEEMLNNVVKENKEIAVINVGDI